MSRQHAIYAYRHIRLKFQEFLISVLQWLASRLSCLFPTKTAFATMTQKAGWISGSVFSRCGKDKVSAPSGNQTTVVQPIVIYLLSILVNKIT